ncbi:phosphoesterase family-domain-containing protein [Podospora aff. communis PSN243]|uniref:Phosphoesterase family-domain-containing protein n=1 Tax=Podospora aff. communis PSN243 TaxID=3040156 RepID=A0AAV9H1P8_9PEZI|nr:phosphoesterase family-domain-containing protein [Podospora aff. communis PSN243]
MKPLLTLVTGVITAHAFTTSQPYPTYQGSQPPYSAIQPSLASIHAAKATTAPSSPTSHVKGKAFDRIVQIWLENIDFPDAASNPNFQWLAERAITLTNYFAVTHPSQPNYAAAVAGEYFGMDHDDFVSFPSNIFTVADLLDTRNISWGEYQEHIPYPGFQGMNYSNQLTGADDYVRKHNPLVLFERVSADEERGRRVKGFDEFWEDVRGRRLPQWVFVTPNMTNNAHDTDVGVAGRWTREFLKRLLGNEYFMEGTLVVVTFDESGGEDVHNRVYTLLLGGAIPGSLWGTTDDGFYTHYSTISTVSVNWDLPSLGRWDCNANVLPPLLFHGANRYQNAKDFETEKMFYNLSYPGPMSQTKYTKDWWPRPNTIARCASGMGVLEEVKQMWGNMGEGSYDYTRAYPDDGLYGHGDVHGKGHGYAWTDGTGKKDPKEVPEVSPPAVVSGAALTSFRSLWYLGYVAVAAVLFL